MIGPDNFVINETLYADFEIGLMILVILECHKGSR